jgi:hypothetical protein
MPLMFYALTEVDEIGLSMLINCEGQRNAERKE